MTRRHRVMTGLLLAAALVALAGCGGGGSSTSPSGTLTLQGQILREPTAQISRAGLVRRLWAALTIRDAWAAPAQPVPMPDMTVTMSVNGRSMGRTMTDAAGRFRFDGMPAGMVEVHAPDRTGRRTFDHSLTMDQMMATSCVIWGSGSDLRMSCADEPGDHWDDMMNGDPAGRWDMGAHGWRRGMM